MNKILVILVVLAASYLGHLGVLCYLDTQKDEPFVANHVATLQERTSHMLVLTDKQDDLLGHCTGTAIGPHAILTAEHCQEDGIKYIQVDLARQKYNVQKVLKDNNEHAVLLLDGPAFSYIEPYHQRDPIVNENEHFYGFGGKIYPSTYKSGIVVNEFDPSEADVREGVRYYSSDSIPGDSGAAVYGYDGTILTLVTMHHTRTYWFWDRTLMIGYGMRFTPEQIEEARVFAPKCLCKAVREKSAKVQWKGTI